MKLYILRHEERDLSDPSFHIELTENGKYKAKTVLKAELEDLNITQVYCSPFIRTLQTVQPFCDDNGICPKVDYSLYEAYNNNILFIDESNRRRLTNIEKIMYSVDSNYKCEHSEVQPKYPDSKNERVNRVSNFLSAILNKYNNTDENVLLCTHGDIVHIIYEKFHNKSYYEVNNNEMYPMGLVTLVYTALRSGF